MINESEALKNYKHEVAEKRNINVEAVNYYNCFYHYTYDHFNYNDCPVDEIIQIVTEIVGGPNKMWQQFKQMLISNNAQDGYDNNYYETLWNICNEVTRNGIAKENYVDLLNEDDANYNAIANELENLIDYAEMWKITQDNTITGIEGCELFTSFLKYLGI